MLTPLSSGCQAAVTCKSTLSVCPLSVCPLVCFPVCFCVATHLCISPCVCVCISACLAIRLSDSQMLHVYLSLSLRCISQGNIKTNLSFSSCETDGFSVSWVSTVILMNGFMKNVSRNSIVL